MLSWPSRGSPSRAAARSLPRRGPASASPSTTKPSTARERPDSADQTFLAADVSAFTHPTALPEFTKLFHLPPVEQGKTGTCWSFAATSLLESELRRQGKAEVKLSEMHTVYWEYVEKARRFIREKGASFLGQGSEPNSALARIKQYGLVREIDYPGLIEGRTAHDHGTLFREIRDYLTGLAAKNTWAEDPAIAGRPGHSGQATWGAPRPGSASTAGR